MITNLAFHYLRISKCWLACQPLWQETNPVPCSQPPKHLTVIRLGGRGGRRGRGGQAGVRDGDASHDARFYCCGVPSLKAVVCHVIERFPLANRNVVARINGWKNYLHNIGILYKHIQSWAKKLVCDCEKLHPAIAQLFCLALPGSWIARFEHFLAGLCILSYSLLQVTYFLKFCC